MRDNLHIVLCMSPVGDAFRTRCRMFPSLVNCCTIDWFIEWPREALLSVATTFFETVDLGADEMKVCYWSNFLMPHFRPIKALLEVDHVQYGSNIRICAL